MVQSGVEAHRAGSAGSRRGNAVRRTRASTIGRTTPGLDGRASSFFWISPSDLFLEHSVGSIFRTAEDPCRSDGARRCRPSRPSAFAVGMRRKVF